jgi:DNA-binding CsgD family transcriptional regulator
MRSKPKGELGRAVAVLRLIAQGQTVDGIALQMGVTRYRVRKRWRMIQAELGANTRSHAVAIAWRKGLIR